MMLYAILTVLLILMLVFPASAFIRNKNHLISIPFVLICTSSALFSYAVYALIGSAAGLEHYNLQLVLQKMGGIDVIIQKIEKRLEEHPDDTQGRKILEQIRKSSNTSTSNHQ